MSSGLLPLFPLGTVLFPGLVLPLHIFEQRYRTLVRDLVTPPDSDITARPLEPGDPIGEFGVIAIRRGWEVAAPVDGPPAESGQPAEPGQPVHRPAGQSSLTLYEVGCSAEIRQYTELPDGRFDLVTVGRRRFRLIRVTPTDKPYLTAEVEWLPESTGDPARADELAAGVLAAFQRYLRLMRRDDEPGEQLPDDPTVLSHLVAATASLTLDDRQKLLALPDTVSRLRAERVLLRREAALLGQVRAVPVTLTDLAVPASPN